jgi:flagellar biosynthesis protein FlhF
MTVKRFVAPDMRRALDLVRQEMGPEAIILSSKRVKDGVEILTADELDIPTRGYDTRQAFGQQFDPEADRPMASDRHWQPDSQQPTLPSSNPVKPATPPADGAARAAALAKEIEAARERMLAAKRLHQEANRPIGEPARKEPSLHQRLDALTEWELEPPVSLGRREPRLEQARQPRGLDAVAQLREPRPEAADGQLAQLISQVEEQRRQAAPQVRAALESGADHQRLNALQAEIADMRALLEQHLSRDIAPALKDTAEKPAVGHYALGQNLTRLGLTSDLVDKLCQQVAHQSRLAVAWREVLTELATQLPVNASDCVDKGGIFAFVGPTGVGKTTTLAKLAARYVLSHGQGKVAIITTDTYRVGAQDQLRALGRILNVPVRVIDQERSLPSVIASLQAFPLILIDTAGFRQGDPLLREQEAILASAPSVQRILVMASNSQLQTLKASAHAYRAKRLSGCVLTKIDETQSLGEAISVLVQQAIPLLYTTAGQEIPKDIAVASAQSLVAQAVGLAKSDEAARREAQQG